MSKEEYVIHISDDTFEQEVIKSARPVLVDFWAPWCGPCRAIGPVLEEIAESYKDSVTVAKVNVDENPKTAAAYGVMSIPTIFLFKGGDIVDKLVGLVPKSRLEELIKKCL